MKFRFNPITTIAAMLGISSVFGTSVREVPPPDGGNFTPHSPRTRLKMPRRTPKSRVFPKHTPPGAVGQQPDPLFPGIRQRRAEKRAAAILLACGI